MFMDNSVTIILLHYRILGSISNTVESTEQKKHYLRMLIYLHVCVFFVCIYILICIKKKIKTFKNFYTSSVLLLKFDTDNSFLEK